MLSGSVDGSVLVLPVSCESFFKLGPVVVSIFGGIGGGVGGIRLVVKAVFNGSNIIDGDSELPCTLSSQNCVESRSSSSNIGVWIISHEVGHSCLVGVDSESVIVGLESTILLCRTSIVVLVSLEGGLTSGQGVAHRGVCVVSSVVRFHVSNHLLIGVPLNVVPEDLKLESSQFGGVPGSLILGGVGGGGVVLNQAHDVVVGVSRGDDDAT